MSKTKTPTAIVEGPQGLKMPEATARHIEELSKGLPAECTYRRMAKTPAESPRFDVDNQGFKTDVSLITTDDVDRDNEVVLPGGIDMADFMKSPTVFFNHEYDKPIGRAMYVDKVKNGLRAMTRYAKRPTPWEGPWLPDALHSMAQEGIATGKSIGFIPLEMREVTPEDLQARPDWKDAVNIIVRAIMLEFSFAPLPANQNALTLAVSKKLVDRATLKMLGRELPTRTVVFIPAPKSIVIPKTFAPVNRSKSMVPAKYAHLNFTPPKDAQKAFKDGADRHAAGESKGHATPEMAATAMHCAAGGDMSPSMLKKCKSYHDNNEMHLSADPGTPAHCLAMMHGGLAGKAYADTMCKAMDAADAGQTAPGPATAVDENGGPAADAAPVQKSRVKGDAMGAMENENGDGGYSDPGGEDTMTPMCPDCKTNSDVVKSDTGYKCKKCGKAFAMDVNDNGSAGTIGDDGATPADPGSRLLGNDKAPVKSAKEQAEEITKAAKAEVRSQMPSIVQEAREAAKEAMLMAMGAIV